ncbi:MAG TPA: response regulator [Solirubrobacteraceae bacterium]|nr:response regulator [Solirubrobacteraceae bacterium]
MTTGTIEPSREATTHASRPPVTAGRSAPVLVVENDDWLRSRMCHLLEAETGLRLAGVSESAEDAARRIEQEPVDVAVIGHRPRSWSALRLCCELKRTPAPPAVVICSAYPDGVLAACSVVAEADALVSMYDCDAELSSVLRRVSLGARLLPAVPPRVGAMLHERLEAPEHAIFSMLLAGIPAADVARGLRMSQAELESRRSTLLGKLETLPPTSRTRY